MDKIDQILSTLPRYSPSENLFENVQAKILKKENEAIQVKKLTVPFITGFIFMLTLDVFILLKYSSSSSDTELLANSLQTNTNIFLYEQ